VGGKAGEQEEERTEKCGREERAWAEGEGRTGGTEIAMTSPISISPKYTTADWKLLEFKEERDWERAVKMLEDRIEGRFFKVIRLIQPYGYAGFAILALDCLLIETLEQFYRGTDETPGRESKAYFRNFLMRSSFKGYFTPDMANDFYTMIRCGILHQAEVKGSSLVLRRASAPMVANVPDSHGLAINRVKFHKELVKVFQQYTSDLRNPANDVLRQNYRKKMNFICQTGAVC
jgi:hypothetical protein